MAANGISRRDIDARLAAGKLVRVARGYYARAPEHEYRARHELQIAAYLDRCAADAVLSHQSAAVLHGLPLRPGDIGEVSVIRPTRTDGGGGQRNREVKYHRMPVDEDDVVQRWVSHRHARVTSVARTVADLARQSLPWGLVAGDAALAQGCERHELARVVRKLAGRTGVSRARAVAELANRSSESPAESLSRAYLHLAGLPAPVVQFRVVDGANEFIARTDFGWPDYRVVGECDGLAKYVLTPKPSARRNDRSKPKLGLLLTVGRANARWVGRGYSTAMSGDMFLARSGASASPQAASQLASI